MVLDALVRGARAVLWTDAAILIGAADAVAAVAARWPASLAHGTAAIRLAVGAVLGAQARAVTAPYAGATLALRGRLLLGAFGGVLFAYSVGLWFAHSVSVYYQQPPAVGVAVFFGVALTMVSPYYVAFAACYGPLARRFRLAGWRGWYERQRHR